VSPAAATPAPAPQDGWEQEQIRAEFDRIRERFQTWAAGAPRWPPFDSARRLIERLGPRLDDLELGLGQVLVVGFFGGSGTGKSHLVNALLGRRGFVAAGREHRPTTRIASVICHPEVDPSFLRLEPEHHEVRRLALPLLEPLILIDCPDPDTQDPSEPGGRHLEILRAVVPHCDVLVHIGTSQKYKSHVIGQELLKHAPGQQLLFVQTHAAIDADNREDWRKHLEALGFVVPRPFRLDSEAALTSAERGMEPDAEFRRFRDLLQFELAGAARHRIRRTNLLSLYRWLLQAIRTEIEAKLPPVVALEQAVARFRGELFARIKARLGDQLLTHRQLWRTRLIRQVAQSWGGGPFALLLRGWSAGGSLVRALLLTRARTPVQALLAAGVTVGFAVHERWRERQQADAWVVGADLGIDAADLVRARSVLRGHLADAGIDPELLNRESRPGTGAGTGTGTNTDPTAEELADLARQLYQRVEAMIHTAIERRVARLAGQGTHLLMELAFGLLPAFLLYHAGKNFFYDYLILDKPLLGLNFFLQAAFWAGLWGAVLGSLLVGRLHRGLDREITRLVGELTPEGLLGSIFADAAGAATAIHRHTEALAPLQGDLDRLQERIGQVKDLDLGWLQIG
jgi:hypothetical protein